MMPAMFLFHRKNHGRAIEIRVGPECDRIAASGEAAVILTRLCREEPALEGLLVELAPRRAWYLEAGVKEIIQLDGRRDLEVRFGRMSRSRLEAKL